MKRCFRWIAVVAGFGFPAGPAGSAEGQPTPAWRLPLSFHGISPAVTELARDPLRKLALHARRDGQHPPNDETADLPEAGPANPTADAPVQTVALAALGATPGANFEGPGAGIPGFAVNTAPSDATLAVGPDRIVAWVNAQFMIFDRAGIMVVPAINGNSLFAGVGGVCETTNRGDPLVKYDARANRWIFSQWAFNLSGSAPVAPVAQCFAISTSADPAGTYYRYVLDVSALSASMFSDYAKLGIWHDAYYTSYDMFSLPSLGFSGAGLCASDRTRMLAGDASATTLCAPFTFHAGGAAFLPADLDGTTLPADLSQGGIFMRFSSTPALRIVKLKPDFALGNVTLGDGFGGTATSFVDLPLTATPFACNGQERNCIAQPGTSNRLTPFDGRLMYRLAYRNRHGIESLVGTQTVDPDGGGPKHAALRWYEIRNPLGNPSDPVLANRPAIAQNGTYSPGASGDRWMGSIGMDRHGNMLIGYSLADAANGIFPSIAVAGRRVGDAPNQLRAEEIAWAGTGSQTGTLSRWGDYSTLQLDPVDDETFWYTNQYLANNGTFNWRTRIVSYRFPVLADALFANGFE